MPNDHSADRELASACVRGDATAIARLEKTYFPELAKVIRRIDASTAFIDEVLQRLRTRLLVDQPPRLAGYAGTGPLGGWLRVAALREALMMRRGVRREDGDDTLDAFADAAPNPEQALARKHHAEAFRAALRQALAAQPSRMRALLGFYYGEGMGVEELGRLYRVHASTVSRWLAQTRDAILAETRKLLAERLELPVDEVDSLLGITGSLEVSLRTLLASAPT